MTQAAQAQPERSYFPRFSAAQRYEHFVLMVVFIGLAVTGLSQKYAAEKWGEELILLLGGIESTRILHRFLATILMAEAIYHVVAVSYRLFVLRHRPSLLPQWRDVRDLRDWLLSNVGLKAERPAMPHYNVNNKFEYWFTALGTLVLIITGYMLWNPIATTNTLPGEAIPTARVIHSDQALLMVLFVVIWHGYNTLIRYFNRSIFSGKLSHAAMQSDHAEELARLESGEQPADLASDIIAKRMRIFVPVAGVLTLGLAVLLYSFVTFEQTALTTVPRQEVPVFAPQAMPKSGDAKVGAAVWSTVRCALCHGVEAEGGPDGAPALRGTTVDFDTFYAQVRTGTADKMPAFRAEELPDAYVLHLYTWLTSLKKS
ncbi:MAG: cytochrome b/b6 domain-containing protein [Anaerolineae bacterium]|nr:cytochrome b/b6 domain-containing protein [Anaerolineae bacterium]